MPGTYPYRPFSYDRSLVPAASSREEKTLTRLNEQEQVFMTAVKTSAPIQALLSELANQSRLTPEIARKLYQLGKNPHYGEIIARSELSA